MAKFTIAKVGKVVGLQGAFWVHSFCEDDILNYLPWYIGKDISSTIYYASATCVRRSTKRNSLVMTLPSITTIEQAQVLCNHFIWAEEGVLPPTAADEYYWHQLVGMEVMQQETYKKLGVVDHFLRQSSAVDIMVVVQPHGKRLLVPFRQPEIITSIDLSEGTISVDWDDY